MSTDPEAAAPEAGDDPATTQGGSAVEPTVLTDAGQAQAAQAALPEAAARRLERPAFSSALTIPEFAACLHMGIRPVGLVQGFCVSRWCWNATTIGTLSTYGTNPAYRSANYRNNYRGHHTLTSYSCPHNYARTSEHAFYGSNDELTYMEGAWANGYAAAHARMLAEAAEAGAHGVIGVIDATKSLVASDVREFHLLGTAVVMDDEPAPPAVWTTFLAGQRLAKLFEAGMVPVSIVGAFAAVSVRPVCTTEILESGRYDPGGTVSPDAEIRQLSDAHMSVRRLARDRVRSQLGHDDLHGADLQVHEGSVAGRRLFTASLQGTRIRRFRDVEPLPVPVPSVRMS